LGKKRWVLLLPQVPYLCNNYDGWSDHDFISGFFSLPLPDHIFPLSKEMIPSPNISSNSSTTHSPFFPTSPPFDSSFRVNRSLFGESQE